MYVNLINLTVGLFVLTQIYMGAKRGTVYTVAPAVSYIGALLLCKPISIIIRPAISRPVAKLITYFLNIGPDMLKVVAPTLKQSCSKMIIMGISYIVTVLLIRFILYLLHTTEKLPGIKEGSHVLAGCLGLFKSIAIIWLISILLQTLDSMQLCGSLYPMWKSSVIVKSVDQYNILRIWL